MGILDKEIKRIKAEDERLIQFLSLVGHSAFVGYDLSDEGYFFSAVVMVSLPGDKLYVDNRNLITRDYYNSVDDKVFKFRLDSLLDDGTLTIVDGSDNHVNKEFKQELIKEINKFNRGGCW